MTIVRPSPRKDPLECAYWDYAAKGELRLQCCMACNRFRYPPAPACADCGSAKAEWRLLSGRGRIVTWTVFHRSYFPALPAPYAVVSVATEEGPLLVGNLIGTSEPPEIGASVLAEFENAQFDDGKIGRICQWRPADDNTLSTHGERK
ncbi:hypothetical protein EDC40_107254 [Aminobacter aminovorans]|uniref:Predicted nucleic-acid-binding protein containing a Zn-ribbon n=1 Tax=Aminobacter aminovorans TaxID=83263 RepID=A0A381IM45_AMIAI|nr:OB-fold domain-containing protein [Aminobacter aminovorans]TCS25054.1 hypothetical protein EDC40_107254 [Aminobacter aminovorans]SUY28464.1 Predicted nucleic-acid-binding protein containing a Zn-ribbon [Aminobacter aminovorans]